MPSHQLNRSLLSEDLHDLKKRRCARSSHVMPDDRDNGENCNKWLTTTIMFHSSSCVACCDTSSFHSSAWHTLAKVIGSCDVEYRVPALSFRQSISLCAGRTSIIEYPSSSNCQNSDHSGMLRSDAKRSGSEHQQQC